MTKKINFSVIIPVKELNSYLEESIPKILEISRKDYEVIILPNALLKKTPAYLKNKKIKIIPTGKVSPALKRDIGAKKASGKYLAFIDDDAYPEKNWLDVAEILFEKEKSQGKNTAAIGGPAITPKTDSDVQKASGLFFETLFGGGGMSYRYKPAKRDFYVEDYPSVNLIVSRNAFLDVGGFDNEFWPGEDTKFCLDLTKKGYKILYSKDLIIYHHRRKSVSSHIRQVGNYGKHRGYFAKKYPETSLKLVYFMPSIFLLGNLILLMLSLCNTVFLYLWIILLCVYFAAIAIDVSTRALSFKTGILAFALVFLSHLSYGFMFLKGLVSRRFKSKLR